MTPGALLARSKLPLQGHICSQLRHKRYCRVVLKQQKKKKKSNPGTGSKEGTESAIQVRGRRPPLRQGCDTQHRPTRPVSRQLFCSTPNARPAPFAQHASYHVTGVYHFTSWGTEGGREGGGLHHQRMLPRSCCFQRLHRSGGSAFPAPGA